MTIRPISSVSFNGSYNKLSFEGKKDRNPNRSSSVSNTLKAIPLATLLAMSPLNSVDAQNRALESQFGFRTEITQTSDGHERAQAEFIYPNAFPSGTDSKLLLFSTDDNSDDFEKAVLDYTKKMKTRKNIKGEMREVIHEEQNIFTVKALKVVNVSKKMSNGTVDHYKEYYADGNLNILRLYRGLDNPAPLEVKFLKRGDSEVEITDLLYNDLKKILGDNIEYTETSKETDDSADDLFFYMY